jgi:hypothetical protein
MDKLKHWLLAWFPWALRRHSHADPTLFKYGTCGRCGHLILSRQVGNCRVSIRAWGANWGATYAKACAPGFTHLELAPDRTVHAYSGEDGERVEMLPDDMTPIGREELARLGADMLAQVAHLKSAE